MPSTEEHPPFVVFDFNENNLRTSLKMDNSHIFDYKLTPNPFFPDAHFEYIIDYLAHLNCKSIVVERNYVDRDFLIDYSHYYVRCAIDYGRLCKRLHFFKDVQVTENNLYQLLMDQKGPLTPAILQDKYLGFIVAKPLPDAIFGRTALATYPSDNKKRNYCCIKKYKANLYGIPLEVDSLAFQEQDTVAAACATSALWSAFHKTSDLFEQSLAPSPIEITEFATRYWFGSRPIPSGGLNVGQMCQAVHQIGLEPHVSNVKYAPEHNAMPLVSFIYAYLKMGIPVILNGKLGNEGHSIALVGYRLEDNKCLNTETRPGASFYYPLIGLRIKQFYAHDDRIGPFCKIQIIDANNSSDEENPVPVKFKIPATGEELEPHSVVVPLYHKIRVVFFHVYSWIWKLHSIISASQILTGEPEWDIHLSTIETFKHDILSIEADKYKHTRPEILVARFPKYLWRCKLSINKQDLFELIADATDMDRSFFFREMIFFNCDFQSQINNLLSQRRDRLEQFLTKQFIDFLTQKSVVKEQLCTTIK